MSEISLDDVITHVQEESRTTHSTTHSTLDDERHHCKVDLLQYIDDKHLIKQFSLSVANATDLPPSTVFLAGLGVFSSMAARCWSVAYQYAAGTLPISLYVVVEQPSGTGKTRCLNIFQSPFQKANSMVKAKYAQMLEQGDLEKEERKEIEEKLNITLFVTNATPEALEQSLSFSKGFFSAVSSEKGLFNSLLGLTYGEGRANNNDIVLNGFNADYISSMRVTRNGYNGFVAGGITLFAQRGSVETILKQSNGTGLAERFLMLAEQDNLGNRNYLKDKQIDRYCTSEYEKICDKFAGRVLEEPQPFNKLSVLTIDDDGWRLINEYRNQKEPHLKAGGKFSHDSLRGAVGKIDMQIMKIAANLHILKYSNLVKPTIDNDTIKSAIDIANELLEARLDMLHDKGEIGAKAEYRAILSYLSKKNNGAKLSEIKNSLRTTQPFKSVTDNVMQAIEHAVNEMLQHGLLTRLTEGSYKIA